MGEGASGEGASRQGGGRVEDSYSESDLDMTEVSSTLPPATREAPAAERGVWVEAGVRKATPRHDRFTSTGPISVTSTAAVEAAEATTAAPAMPAATVTTARAFPRLWKDLRGTWQLAIDEQHFEEVKVEIYEVAHACGLKNTAMLLIVVKKERATG